MPGPGTALGEIIRRQRELSELSMRQLATMAGISNPYLSQIERGLREPSEKVLDAIATTLETSADKLYEQAGFAPAEEADGPSEVEAAIEADVELSPRQRQALLEIYRAFRATGPRPPRPRRRAAA
jgi:transcriptional regulator with XRE-family HTH domain